MNKIYYLMIIIVALLASSCAMQKSNLAGRINGTEITYTDFVAAHRGHFNNFMAEKGRTPDAEEKKEILRQTWRNITIHVILKKQFEKYNITVTPQEVIDTLIIHVPPYLRTSPLLQVNGRFDRSLYQQSLEYDTPVNLTPIKQRYMDYLIPIQKLKTRLIENTMLTKREAKLISDIYGSSANIEWVVFDPKDSRVSISDNEIQSYYQSNLSRFGNEKATKLDFCMVKVGINPEDYALTMDLVDSLYTALTKGTDFAAMAEKHSVSESSLRGGNLGFMRIADLPEYILAHLNNLKPGEISTPLQTPDSWNIYQIGDRTRTMIRLNEIVIKPAPGNETIDSYLPQVETLIELGKRFGLQEAAYEMDMDFYSTDVMHQDSLWINDLEVVNAIKARLANARAKTILEPVYSNKLSTWIVVQVMVNQTRKFKSLSEVRAQIVHELEESKRMQITGQIASQWLLLNPKPASATLKPQGYSVHKTDAIRIGDTMFGEPVEYLLYQVIKDHRDKKIKPHVFAGYVLIPVVNSVSTAKNHSVETDKILELYMKTLSPDWFDKWLETQIKSASVKKW